MTGPPAPPDGSAPWDGSGTAAGGYATHPGSHPTARPVFDPTTRPVIDPTTRPGSSPTARPGSYPDSLPPPVAYPTSRRRRPILIAAAVALVALLAGGATLAVLSRSGDPAPPPAPVSDATAKSAIQDYLNALSRGDDETIARHASCGLFDALTDKKSDLALADLASDAFRRQFSQAQVRSIDKIVTGSPTQVQVLFTMDAQPARGGGGSRDMQAVAQILVQGREALVCSYLPRVAQY